MLLGRRPPVHAAAAARSSSRPSRPAASRTTNHRRQPSPSGSIPHDRDYWIATPPPRSRLLLVLNRLPSRSLNCAVRPSTQACNRHTQPPSQPSIPAAVASLSPHCSRHRASRSFAHTFRLSQIPITEAAAPPPIIARGFVPCRLSDAGHPVRGSVDHGRHPKPCAEAAVSRCSNEVPIVRLFDHLVGAGEQRRGYVEAERPRRPQVDDKLEPRGLLDGQISRFRAFENLVHEGSSPTPNVGKVYSICGEAARFAIFPETDARQPISYRKFCNAFGVGDKQPFVDDRMCFDLRLGLRKGRVQLVETSNLHVL